MKIFFYVIAAVIVLVCMSSLVFAAGGSERGNALFNDPKAFGGVSACSACHPDGSGLENVAEKKVFHIAGGTQKSLEDAVNACIVNASGGKAIDIKSARMKDIVAYIKSLKKK